MPRQVDPLAMSRLHVGTCMNAVNAVGVLYRGKVVERSTRRMTVEWSLPRTVFRYTYTPKEWDYLRARCDVELDTLVTAVGTAMEAL